MAHQAVLEAIPRQRECSHPKQKGGLPHTSNRPFVLYQSSWMGCPDRATQKTTLPTRYRSFLAEVDLDLRGRSICELFFFLVVAALVVLLSYRKTLTLPPSLVVLLSTGSLALTALRLFSGRLLAFNPLHCLLQGNGVNLGVFGHRGVDFACA